MKKSSPLCVADIEKIAKEVLEPKIWDFYSTGAMDLQTLRDNTEAFKRWRIRPRVLKDVSNVTLETTILGDHVSCPVGLSPASMQCAIHPDGEEASAQAAIANNVPMILSTYSTRSIEEVASHGKGKHANLWFQLYVYKDRRISEKLVQRAEKAGFKALVLTVDSPLVGRRLLDARNRFSLPPPHRFRNFDPVDDDGMAAENLTSAFHSSQSDTVDKAASKMAEMLASTSDKSLTFADIAWLRKTTSMKIVLKGIMTAEDAALAVEAGVDAIMVSNHGGRQLDGVLATIDALPEVVQAVENKCEVYVDSGFRTGTDILKALALGARAVFLGRPYLYGLAYNGVSGINQVLQLLVNELELSMALAGVSSVDQLTVDHLEYESSAGRARYFTNGRLKGQNVLITGASSGIGEACARSFARAGSNVILTARRAERLTALKASIEKDKDAGQVHTVPMDVRDRQSVMQSLKNLPPNLKEIDVLVNNAGLVIGLDKIEVISEDAINTMLDTNVKGLLNVTQAVLPGMRRRQKGHIINIGSVSGKQVYAGGGVYCASKHAVNALSRTLLLELVDSPVKVTEINPGMVETEFSVVRFSGDQEKADSVYEGLQPLTGDDIADLIIFAASRPAHVNIADMLVFPVNQADARTTHRQ
ncbi:hypothetical protein BZG36_03016 [Bifiguratus adelaidae]|uniref:Oxidase FUB9 n=1 Tax=Bifiguratus adelaidae TaxID=1938954 RepID=A0A261XZQ8_9FUNG|nr:hypothetical protein BZG36_03016 [Bifiguratus adelaidae]